MMHKNDVKQVWVPYGASVAGVKHQNQCSEDGYYTAVLRRQEHTFSCVSVCDGVSDQRAPCSMFGAQLFSQTAAQFLMPQFKTIWESSEQDLNNITVEYRREAVRYLERWRDEAETLGMNCPHVLQKHPETGERSLLIGGNIQQYATTLQTVMVSDEGQMIYLSIGDGCCQIKVGQEMIPLSQPPLGLGQGTAHITFASIGDVLCHLRWQRLWLPPETSGIYVMTDGGKFPGGLYHGKAMQAQEQLERVDHLLKKKVHSDGSQMIEDILTNMRTDPKNDQFDDITLAALVCLNPAGHRNERPAEQLIEEGRLYRRNQRTVR